MVANLTNVRGNIDKALKHCDRAASKRINILCFPECASAGWMNFWFTDQKYRHKFYAKPIPGPMVNTFSQKDADTDMYIIFGTPE